MIDDILECKECKAQIKAELMEKLPKEIHGEHDGCWEIDCGYCIPCGEDVDIHPKKVSGFNDCLSQVKQVIEDCCK